MLSFLLMQAFLIFCVATSLLYLVACSDSGMFNEKACSYLPHSSPPPSFSSTTATSLATLLNPSLLPCLHTPIVLVLLLSLSLFLRILLIFLPFAYHTVQSASCLFYHVCLLTFSFSASSGLGVLLVFSSDFFNLTFCYFLTTLLSFYSSSLFFYPPVPSSKLPSSPLPVSSPFFLFFHSAMYYFFYSIPPPPFYSIPFLLLLLSSRPFCYSTTLAYPPPSAHTTASPPPIPLHSLGHFFPFLSVSSSPDY
jgi:hypothetical protein